MTNIPKFTGMELGRKFYFELVEPLLREHYPELRYAAGLIGSGSEVLGFDDELSSDHHWGPRTMLFLSADDHKTCYRPVWDMLAERLPYNFLGYNTNFTQPKSVTGDSQTKKELTEGPVNHLVEVWDLAQYCLWYLGLDLGQELVPEVWLTFPGQKLRGLTGGEIFRDDSGELTRLRRELAYYPPEVWLYLLAAGWARIGQEEHFMGRTGYAGDELGSKLIAARLVHDLMNLCFLIERTYPPYSKWFGTAFSLLDCSKLLNPIFQQVLNSSDWKKREKYLVQGFQIVAEMFNGLGLTEPLSTEATQFFGRPFQVIWGDNFVGAIKDQIKDPEVRRIADQTLIGAVEQFSTSTDVLSKTSIHSRFRSIYQNPEINLT